MFTLTKKKVALLVVDSRGALRPNDHRGER